MDNILTDLKTKEQFDLKDINKHDVALRTYFYAMTRQDMKVRYETVYRLTGTSFDGTPIDSCVTIISKERVGTPDNKMYILMLYEIDNLEALERLKDNG